MKLNFRYDPFIDDTIENGNVVGIESMSITYTQPADTDSDRDEVQFLKVESMTVPGDDEPYYRISMPEGGIWSIEDPEDLTQIIEDFKSRLGLKKKEEEVKEEKKEVTIEEIMKDSYSALHQEVVTLLKKNCNLISRPKRSELLSDLFINEEEWKNTIGQLEEQYNIDLTDINSNIIVGELVQKIYLKIQAAKYSEAVLDDVKYENYKKHSAQLRQEIFDEIKDCLKTWFHIYDCDSEMYKIESYRGEEVVSGLIDWLNQHDYIKDYQKDKARIKLSALRGEALRGENSTPFTVKKIIDLVRAFQEEDAAY